VSESNFSANGLVFSENQTGRFTFQTAGWHELSFYVEDIHGCSAEVSKQIFFNGDALVYIPNAFTPTNDFLNEVFGPVITATHIQRYSFTIFNRWGEKVFETTDPEMMWNGSVNNSSYYAGDGVYSYRLVFTYEGGKPFEKVGHLTMLR
jgi:gliding motility-associated-like protein